MSIFRFSVGSDAKSMAVPCVFAIGVVCWANCQKPSQVFWQCPFSFALFFGKHKHVAHSWTGVEFEWLLTQDGAGRLELVGNAFKITGEIADIDDLKKVHLASRFLRFFIRKCHDN